MITRSFRSKSIFNALVTGWYKSPHDVFTRSFDSNLIQKFLRQLLKYGHWSITRPLIAIVSFTPSAAPGKPGFLLNLPKWPEFWFFPDSLCAHLLPPQGLLLSTYLRVGGRSCAEIVNIDTRTIIPCPPLLTRWSQYINTGYSTTISGRPTKQ